MGWGGVGGESTNWPEQHKVPLRGGEGEGSVLFVDSWPSIAMNGIL